MCIRDRNLLCPWQRPCRTSRHVAAKVEAKPETSSTTKDVNPDRVTSSVVEELSFIVTHGSGRGSAGLVGSCVTDEQSHDRASSDGVPQRPGPTRRLPALYFRRCRKRHIFAASEFLHGRGIHQAGVRSSGRAGAARRRAGRDDKARRPSRCTGWAPPTILLLVTIVPQRAV